MLLKTSWLHITNETALLISPILCNWELSNSNNLLSHCSLMRPQITTCLMCKKIWSWRPLQFPSHNLMLMTEGSYQASQLNHMQALWWNAQNAQNPHKINFTSQQFGTYLNGWSSFLTVMLHLSMLSLFMHSSTSRLWSMSKKQSVKDSHRACLLQMVWYHDSCT